MEPVTFLLQLVAILCAARFSGELAGYFKIPPVIGELVAGILLGPSLLGWIELSDAVKLLAEIGIILLLFEVGLETDMGQLISAGGKAAVVAVVGLLLPLIGGFFLSYFLFKFSLLASLFVGATLTATSIGITLRVLRDLKKQNTSEAQIILGAAVLDDILGIVLLALLYEFSASGSIQLWTIGKVLLFISFFFLSAPLAGKGIAELIRIWERKSEIPGLLPTTIVALILFFAWLAHQLGAPDLLGGFAAGLALSKQFYFPFDPFPRNSPAFTHKVEEQMTPIVHLFTPIFFVAIGLSLNLKQVAWGSSFIWILTASLLGIALVGKLLSGFFISESRFKQVLIGTAMIPRGEMGLIFANVALTSAVIHNEMYAALILVITLTTLLAPFALRWLYQKAL